MELKNHHFELVQIENERKLLQRLYLKAVYCYYAQGLQYRQGKNHGLADLSLQLAEETSKQAQLSY